ncbi:hypothetical protein MD535_23975 [Vibrio sp. ZSDZ65]|uniref:Uncharacterized protein n=1 Tax=Vibrio qingdaonensis TaxID=2829491 RepID=A0A9X3CTC0_9VIBR|nr:hypothetical protein [Vibrio qingdaonensis]MCW8349053.1 hypothetical protein [Vibrio qingdaonensis]
MKLFCYAGLIAKLPLVVYRYPVYDLDIGDYNFNIIDLGNRHQVDENGLAYIEQDKLVAAAQATIQYLLDSEMRSKNMESNYLIGEKNLSYPALKNILTEVFAS